MAIRHHRIGKLAALLCLGLLSLMMLETSGMLAGLKSKLKRCLFVMDSSEVRDYGALVRYREANLRLGPPKHGESRVIFFGDSITQLWSELDEGGWLASKGYLNRGISGQTTSQMLLRFRQDVIELQPSVVVILGGTNDIALDDDAEGQLQVITGNLASMSELARAHNIRVVLASVLPVNNYARDAHGAQLERAAQRPLVAIKSLNEQVRQYAAQNGDTYLDYFSRMVDANGMLRQELSDDGLHPNQNGYALMAPLAEEAIDRALRQR